VNIQRRNSNYLFIFLLWIFAIFSSAAFGVTESVRVSANNDDAEENVSNGNMDRGSNDLDIDNTKIIGMRFRSVDIPQGATINSAYIEFEADEADNGTTNLVIYGQDADSPNQFSNGNRNISNRTQTSASVSWSPSAWNSVNGLHQTSEIKSIIQEIVNRSGWSSGNNLVLMIEPGSGCSSNSCRRVAESRNGESDAAPLLVVDYSVGGSGTNFTGSLNVDNTFSAYISTDDSVQGTLLTSGADWPTTEIFATNLTAGQDYYLHIYATDVGGVAGFLGDFELTGTEHIFSNSLTTLNTNTSDWSVSTSGWSNYLAASGYGTNGVSPWGTRSGVDSNAQWIWSSDNNGHNVNYFSTKISAAVTPPNSCAPHFTDVAQGNTGSSYIWFRDSTHLINEPDNIISFPSITDNASDFTCNTVDCTATTTSAPALTLPTFETTSTNTNFSRSSGSSTIGSGGTHNSNEIKTLTVDGSANVTFLASTEKYIIKTANFSSSSVVTFNEGEYWIDKLKIKDSAEIIINGSVTIFLNDHSDIEGSSKVNISGPAKNLAIVGYERIHLKGSAEVHGAIYNDGGSEIKMESSAKVIGAVSASGKLELKDSSTITYEDISDVEVGDLCGGETFDIQSVSGSCSALEEVTVVFSDDVEQSSAETVGNYQITNPSGGTISINSAIRTASNTVTLVLGSTLNDLTEYAVVVNNVQNLNGESIAAGSVSSFSLSCNLNCITDTFAGPGGLSSSWSASSSSGSFGTPRIVENGRLRLTDDTGQVATVATLLNQFPGAGNKVEIEFDYYGYGGSGADGIAVTFSDASIPPVPGSYGGALGYAQRSGGTPGFTGGWLGIGIDEYGNFANPNEGKIGGTAREIDSVALRGSGDGMTGYNYLTSTGTLSPGIDASGSTANPGHRYRLSIDHTMGGREAYATVERDTGSGFVEIIPRFDIFTANLSQADVPTNLVVSLTGSTGGSTNIHEIGGLEVCAALPIDSYGSPDHYEIIHDGSGVTCGSETVTIKACMDSACSSLSSEQVTLDFQGNGSTISSRTFTGSETFSFNHTTAETLGLSIDNESAPAKNATKCDSGPSTSCDILFADAGFRFYANSSHNLIGTQVSGKPSNVAPSAQSLTLRAVRTNTDTGACEAAIEGTTAVDLAYECNNPTTCTASDLLSFTGASTTMISRNDDGASLGYSSVDMEFDANGEAPFLFNYADAGRITLHARKSVAANEPEPAFELIGQSNAFWVSPAKLLVTAKNSVGNEINGVSSGSSTIHKAGVDFDLVVTAVNSSGAITPNYQPGQNQFQLARTAPTTGTDGSLTYSTGNSMSSALSPAYNNIYLETFNAGVSSYSAANYSEVGLLNLDLQDSNYGGEGITVPGDAIDIGRFTPDHFIVTGVNGAFDESCGTGFTYIGQDFGYDNSVALPSLTIVAKNKANATTQNYTDTNFLKLQPSGVARVFPTADSRNGKSGVPLNATMPSVFQGSILGGASAGLNEGEVKFTFNSADSYQYTKNVNSEIVNFNTDLVIAVTGVIDVDSVTANNLSSALEIKPAEIDIRYGRWVMQNVFGPETENLVMPGYMEYLDSATGSYVVNTADSCTELDAIAPSGSSPFPGSIVDITLGSGTTDLNCNYPLVAGEADMLFTAPDAGNTGSVDIDVDLSSLPWLRYNWDGSVDGSLEDHAGASVTFGQFRGHDRIIYWREIGI